MDDGVGCEMLEYCISCVIGKEYEGDVSGSRVALE